MGEHVAAVTVSDEQHIIDELNRVITYVGHMLRTSVLCLLALIALQRIEDDKNQSVFYGKEGYKIIFIVAELCAVFVAQIIVLSCCLPSNPLSDIHYTILKFIGNLSAFLAPYSVVMLIVDLPHLDAYLVACVMFGIIVTCFFLDDHQQYKKPSIFMIAVSMLVPGLIFTFWISQVNSILLIHICLWVEIAYHFITYLMFIVEKTLEARKPPQQDEKNDYPRYNYLHVLRRNDETQKLIA